MEGRAPPRRPDHDRSTYHFGHRDIAALQGQDACASSADLRPDLQHRTSRQNTASGREWPRDERHIWRHRRAGSLGVQPTPIGG